jgi:(E)-4-hydroxy-3-methylbut-2-enyl-diphosphate synthase
MDSVVQEVEHRLQAYDDPIEVSVLGCAVNGIGEARHADFGITGAKDAGMIFSKGEPLKKVKTSELVDELFKEIDRYYASGKQVVRDEREAAEATQWLSENEDLSAMTPERLAQMEKDKQRAEQDALAEAGSSPVAAAKAFADESSSPTAGRRFTRSS